ncbi:MAG: hypothetical protein K2P98_06490 [Neisseriaceae bacterium]|nr:hypothetical protein [Neisseriaceae bacterium]
MTEAEQEEFNLKQEEKSKADKEIQLLNECINSYFALKSQAINQIDKIKTEKDAFVFEGRLQELLETSFEIYQSLDMLQFKTARYKDEIIPDYPFYFGTALYHPTLLAKPSTLWHINDVLCSITKELQTPIKDIVLQEKTTWPKNLTRQLDTIKQDVKSIQYRCERWEILYVKHDNDVIRKEIHKSALITSFNETTKELKQLKTKWYWLFFGIVGCLVLLGILELIQQFKLVGLYGLQWQIDWKNLFIGQGNGVPSINWNAMLKKASLILPLIWLAWFAAKRLNVLSKLETDYQFKEATAKTFESYKNEIEALKDDELKKQLLSTVIRNFGDNPVRLFDPKDDKGHTAEELLELAKKLKDITK